MDAFELDYDFVHVWAFTHMLSSVFRGPCASPPPGRTAVIFVTILGLFLAPFRDKIAATSDQMRCFGRKML